MSAKPVTAARQPTAQRAPGTLRRRATRLLLAPAYGLYSKRLRREVARAPLPAHVAVILDGNRRWASDAGLPTPASGHQAGADKLDELLDWCAALGVEQVTVWALSNENLLRPDHELDGLIDVVADKLDHLAARHALQSVRVRVVGRLQPLPGRLRHSIEAVEQATATNDGLRLNIALGYSGRDELVDATRALVRALANTGAAADQIADQITAEALSAHLYTVGEPDPDLIIRTSGQLRLSGFLLWQSAHSELYFTDVYWPALRELDFLRALRSYQQRERRYGR